MAVKIRLTRKGKKRQPTYRVVVADSRSPRDGRFIEQIGRYDPRQEPSLVEIDNERAAYWLARGAQPSHQVRKLLEISGTLEARAVKAQPVKDPKVHVVDEVDQIRAEREAAIEMAEAPAEVEAAEGTEPEPTGDAAEMADASVEVEASEAPAEVEAAEGTEPEPTGDAAEMADASVEVEASEAPEDDGQDADEPATVDDADDADEPEDEPAKETL